jgi:hypothetical protein
MDIGIFAIFSVLGIGALLADNVSSHWVNISQYAPTAKSYKLTDKTAFISPDVLNTEYAVCEVAHHLVCTVFTLYDFYDFFWFDFQSGCYGKS